MSLLSKTTGLGHALCLAVCLTVSSCQDFKVCNRRPLAVKTEPLPADDRFVIDIVGVIDDKYIPSHKYKIRLHSRQNQTSFIAFTISAYGDHKYNEKNPRKPLELKTGRIFSFPDPLSPNNTVTSDICDNTVFQNDITPKTEVVAQWIAPDKGNQCVTIYAYVAVKPDVWYSSEGPLSRRVCEDVRNEEDMPPTENDDCQVCEEARYELQFEGMWSFNTHPKMFPKAGDLAKFSDVVGASHSKNFAVFHSNTVASEGLEMLAEQGNTTIMESEILEQLGTNVRTLIKATGPPRPNMTTISSFRVSRQHHLVSLVSAIIPSPDWFLGVANLELCEETSTWSPSVKLNLYPMDAGTDSGSKFESPNEKTSPRQPISQAVIDKTVEKEQIKPFAKLKIYLVRTYATPHCVTESPPTVSGGDGSGERSEPPPPPPRTTEPPLATDPTLRDCPITEWEPWLPCEGPCAEGRVAGYRTRLRYYVVDGVEVGKNFDENASEEEVKDVPEECLKYETSETQKCDEECTEPTAEPEAEFTQAAQRRTWKDPVKPGYNWGERK